uniref:Ig-like domain-containing protein n=1 Tax=Erpetoichthys calabaricus TaxID=27687 RepID=A0A8C4RU01_ERPCA
MLCSKLLKSPPKSHFHHSRGVMMVVRVFILLIPFNWLPNFCFCVDVKQTPPSFLARLGRSYTLECHNSDSSYTFIYWYHQPKEQNTLNYIGHLQYKQASYDGENNKRFTLNGSATETSYLTISGVIDTDSGAYFCAASKHSTATSDILCTKMLLLIQHIAHNLLPADD